LDDKRSVRLYLDGDISVKTVSALAADALKKVHVQQAA